MKPHAVSAVYIGTFAAALLLLSGRDAAFVRAGEPANPGDEVARGKELFLREWIPNDPRSHGGDGLGPVYNDSSCIACHNMGAPGGAGASNKDVAILSALPATAPQQQAPVLLNAVGRVLGSKKAVAADATKNAPAPTAAELEALAGIHLGFRSNRSVVLHLYGTDPLYKGWRENLLSPPTGMGAAGQRAALSKEDAAELEIVNVRNQTLATHASFTVPKEVAGFQLILSRRNTPPLFGAGLIDGIPDTVIEAGAEKPGSGFPETRGRASRLEGGKLGRFGWKGQTANLREFVLTACAVELGLEVPAHSQGAIPHAPAYRPPGMDLDESECAALIAFVRSLPTPPKREPANRRETNAIRAGEEAFQAAGCAACHTPNLGEVRDVYSDLLLHDMGESLSDSGSYGVFVNDNAVAEVKKGSDGDAESKTRMGPERREWRTPPLWGFRDSGPYLHDGRADNLEQAVAFHDGQAARSAQRFFLLSPKQRQKIEAFLKSLTAPSEAVAKRG